MGIATEQKRTGRYHKCSRCGESTDIPTQYIIPFPICKTCLIAEEAFEEGYDKCKAEQDAQLLQSEHGLREAVYYDGMNLYCLCGVSFEEGKECINAYESFNTHLTQVFQKENKMTVEQAVAKAKYIARSINVDERYPLSFAHAVDTIAEALLEASNSTKGE